MERLDSSQNTPQAVDTAAPTTVDLTDTTIEAQRTGSGQPATIEQAKDVAVEAKEQAKDVATEAAEQVRSVAQSAGAQARGTLAGIGEDISRQAEEQKGRVAQLLRELGDELDQAAGRTNGSGPANGQVAMFAGQAASLSRDASRWLDTHRPRDLVDGVNEFARRRPMTFIAASAAAGLLMGRLTRGMVDAARDSSDGQDDTGVGTASPGMTQGSQAPIGGYGYSVPASGSTSGTTGAPGMMGTDEDQPGIVTSGDQPSSQNWSGVTPGTLRERGGAS
jgi:hypothetical protein